MRLLLATGATVTCLLFASGKPAAARADAWLHITTPNFTVFSDAGEGTARHVGWQFEQIRAVIQAGWPWARAELDRPFVVIAVKGESTMRTFAPRYWEERGNLRPSSVSATAWDRHYVLLRTDVRAEGPEGVNPYQTAYWGYTQLLLSDSFEGRLPYWFGRGLSAVLSNTNVTDREVQFGRPIPWYIQELRRGRFQLPDLFALTRESPAMAREVDRQRFDAQCWALVHYLVFGDADRALGERRLNELARQMLNGTPAVTAVNEIFGGVAKLDEAYRLYVERGLFRYSLMKVDARVQRKDFGASPLEPAAAAAVRADYLSSTNRPVEARAAIDESRRLAPDRPATFVAEARIFERESQVDEARAAYEKAVALGTDNFFAYVRLANLMQRAGSTPESLAVMRGLLVKAAELNPRYAAAHQSLGAVLLQLNQTEDGIASLRRAVDLEPLQSGLRMSLASALARSGQREDAMTEAQAALALAQTDQQRAAAQSLIARIGGGG